MYYKVSEKSNREDHLKNNLIILHDALVEYKFAEKWDIDIDKFYDDWIQNNREKEAKFDDLKQTKVNEK